MKEINFNNPEFIPLPKQPFKIEPRVKRWRRKAPRKLEHDTPVTPIRAGVEIIPNGPGETPFDRHRQRQVILPSDNYLHEGKYFILGEWTDGR